MVPVIMNVATSNIGHKDSEVCSFLLETYVHKPCFFSEMPDVDGNIFIPKYEAHSYLRKRARGKWGSAGHGYQGVVCECCYNRCSIMEMKQYCADRSHMFGVGKRSAAVMHYVNKAYEKARAAHAINAKGREPDKIQYVGDTDSSGDVGEDLLIEDHQVKEQFSVPAIVLIEQGQFFDNVDNYHK